MSKILNSNAVSKILAAVIIIIVVVAAIIGAAYYVTLPGPSPSGSPSPSPSGSPSPSPSASPSPSPSASPTYNNTTFTYNWVTDLTGMDPAVAWTTDARTVEQFAYEGLTSLKENTTDIIPSLATNWTVSNDGLNYTFQLRPGVRFSDGTTLDANAVKVSFQRLVGIGQQSADFVNIQQIDVLDTYDVSFILNVSFAPFLTATALMQSFIVNPAALAAHNSTTDPWAKNWFHANTAGTGPYMLQEWVSGDHWIFVQNPYYWRGWAGNHIATIEGIITAEPSVARLMIEKGDTDANYFPTSQDIASYQANPNLITDGYPAGGVKWCFNNAEGPCSNVHVRKAITYAFDYGQALALVLGYGTRMNEPLYPSCWAYDPDVGSDISFNLTLARQELAQSPYPNGGFTIRVIWCAGVDIQRQLCELLKTDLAQLNINLQIDEKAWATFTQLQNNLATAYDIATLNVAMMSPDPNDLLYVRFTPISFGVSNYGWYNNTQFTALCLQAQTTTDQTQRANLYDQAMHIMIDQDRSELYCFFTTRFVIFGKWVHGYIPNTYLLETFGNPWYMYINPTEKTV